MGVVLSPRAFEHQLLLKRYPKIHKRMGRVDQKKEKPFCISIVLLYNPLERAIYTCL
jgi:hypothetical protein